jgi:hypothetical protein
MNFNELLVFYLLVGAAVAVAQVLTDRPRTALKSAGIALAVVAFWPLYLPLLLTRRGREPVQSTAGQAPCDDLAAAIEQVERELAAALASLDGWAEGVLAHQPDRLGELRAALTAHAVRIREMDALVLREQSSPQHAQPAARDDHESNPMNPRWRRSEQARLENMNRLATICRQSRSDLMATLAWVRELVSMIHLAKFTGAPASRAEELVAQIAAAVESISTLSSDSSSATSPAESRLPPIPRTAPASTFASTTH